MRNESKQRKSSCKHLEAWIIDESSRARGSCCRLRMVYEKYYSIPFVVFICFFFPTYTCCSLFLLSVTFIVSANLNGAACRTSRNYWCGKCRTCRTRAYAHGTALFTVIVHYIFTSCREYPGNKVGPTKK